MFLGEVKDLQNVLVTLKAYSPEESGNRKLLFPVDVSVHHIVDVSGKLYPGTLEGDDSCRVELGAVGVDALAEEDAG